MNDLRRDIKDALDRQQSTLHDIPATRARMLHAATEPRGRSAQLLPSLAGVAIVLIAASAVGLTVVLRVLHSSSLAGPHPTPTIRPVPTATPSLAPTPMAKNLNVPATTPVILFHDPANFLQIDGITWDGSASGRVGSNPNAYSAVLTNPTGSLYATTQDIRDRTGAVVSQWRGTSKGLPQAWADDGQHFCTIVSPIPHGEPGGVPATLQLTAVGGAPRNVAQAGRVFDQTSVGVVACSVQNDRAVVTQNNSLGTASQFWVVQLSTGRILWTRPSSDIVASRDGRYVAEIVYDLQTHQTATTTIYSSTGKVLAHFKGSLSAFSWDGSLAVAAENATASLEVVRWSDGTVIWRGPSNGHRLAALAEPSGDGFAILLSDPRFPWKDGFYPGDLYVVGRNGTAVELVTDVVTGF
jgi:hypothetical protein